MSRGEKTLMVAIKLRNDLFFFCGTIKDPAPCASPGELNRFLRCCSANIWPHGEGSCLLCPPVTVSAPSENLSLCFLNIKKKKGLEQEDFGAGMKQLEPQLERQGQKWSLGAGHCSRSPSSPWP